MLHWRYEFPPPPIFHLHECLSAVFFFLLPRTTHLWRSLSAPTSTLGTGCVRWWTSPQPAEWTRSEQCHRQLVGVTQHHSPWHNHHAWLGIKSELCMEHPGGQLESKHSNYTWLSCFWYRGGGECLSLLPPPPSLQLESITTHGCLVLVLWGRGVSFSPPPPPHFTHPPTPAGVETQ